MMRVIVLCCVVRSCCDGMGYFLDSNVVVLLVESCGPMSEIVIGLPLVAYISAKYACSDYLIKHQCSNVFHQRIITVVDSLRRH